MKARDSMDLAAPPQLVRALSGAPFAALVVDGPGRILYANELLLALFGYSAQAVLLEPIEMLLSPEARAAHVAQRQGKAIHDRSYAMGRGLNIVGRHRDGRQLPIEVRLQCVDADHGSVTVAFVCDRRPEQAAHLELERLNRALRLVHLCNGILVRARGEDELLSGIVQSMVTVGFYRLVWVGLLPLAGGAFTNAVHASPGRALVVSAGLTGVEPLARRAMVAGVPILVQADQRDELVEQLAALLPGEARPTILALPLFAAQALLGCICVASNDDGLFLPHEVELLQELADDLAYGLEALRSRSVRASVEGRLRLLERAVQASANAIIITDALDGAHPVLYVNPAFERITGYAASDALGRNGRFLLGEDFEQDGLNTIRAALRGGFEAHALLRNYRKDGSLFWNELTLAPVRDDTGLVTHFVSLMTDVTERKLQEEQIERHALYDALTGLPNRHSLFERIDQLVAKPPVGAQVVGVLLIGLDRFSMVNDAFGHDAGDALLRAVAARLLGALHPSDMVARLGGDEFVVLLSKLVSEDVIAVTERIRAALTRPFPLSCGDVAVGVSIGVSLSPRDGCDAQVLIRNAEVAMQGAKTGAANSVRFYSEDMNRRTGERLAMEFDLRRALERGEFEIHYQPIIDTESGRIVEAEALLRWNRPEHGMVAPDRFIPLAERSGLIVPIGKWVLFEACRQNAKWRAAGLTPIRVGVNLSERQFREPELEAVVAQALAASGLVGTDLVLEVTESLLMTNIDAASNTLLRLKQLGVHISLDDFGTGYSSLAYLKRLPLDTLKIDRSFVRDIGTDANDAAITTTIISMARTMHLGVVAEGVEKPEQLAHLRANGCQCAQGFLFSRPVPAAQLAHLLQHAEWLPG
ncbi:EAL domain-containing protein [Rhodoferax sp.]|uniref:sensor domain-containing protein n=1 Tax=Rhodoferax sp. TaxID=50421 RepID=UPI002758AA47|nr:EAL domain-containing protein [Rhodoferax sp.]